MHHFIRLTKKVLSLIKRLLPIKRNYPHVEPKGGNTTVSPRYGRTIYSSQPQTELEAEAGEKLFKISEGVYVNQVTHDLIQSEHHPVVHEELSSEFTSGDYEKAGVICAAWHPSKPNLICIVISPSNETSCAILKVEKGQLTLVSETIIGPLKTPEQIRDVAHHPKLPHLLVTSDRHLLIWDYADNRLIKEIELDSFETKRGGFYADDQRAWSLSLDEHRAGHDWVIWDYSANEIHRYELEKRGHYGRGATLHPSGLLIGAAWNAYECGYFIHASAPKSGELHYYSQPAPERSEYEAYEPCFSPDGQRFALVVNPYVAMRKNYSRVCVYNIETAELELEFYPGTSLNEGQLQFAHEGKTLAFREIETNKFYVFNATTSKRITTLNTSSDIKYFAGHRLFGYYAAVHETGVSVFFATAQDEISIPDLRFEAISLDVARRFIADNDMHLVEVND